MKIREKIAKAKGVNRRYWIILLVCLLLALVSLIYYFDVQHEVADVEKSIIKTETILSSVLFNTTSRRLRNNGADLTCIAKLQSMQDFLNNPSLQNKLALAEDFMVFSRSRAKYDQIRLLDLNGMEAVRVNLNNGSPSIVPEDKLQDKSNRYYFKNVIKLEKNGIYISLLDLNIENKEIELPWKPMIRYGMPVFDNKGQKKGVLLLNYLAKELIDDFRLVAPDQPDKISLVNEDGYWLHGKSEDTEWGFMFPDRKTQTFQHKYPEEWKEIVAKKYGFIRSDNGLFSFRFVNLINSTTLLDNIDLSSADEKGWYIISHVKEGTISNRLDHAYHSAMVSFAFILASILIITILLMRQQNYIKEEQQNKLMQRSAKEWSNTFDAFVDMIAIAGADKKVKRVNSSFEQRFPERLGKSCYEAFKKFGNMPIICKTCDVFQTGNVRKIEVYAPDDTDHWYDFISTPIFNEEGKVIEVVHSFRDITQQKLNERKIAENANLLKRSQKIGKIGNWFLKFATGELQWSNEVYNIFEVSAEEFIPSYKEFFELVHKDDRKEVKAEWELALENKKPFDVIHRIATKTGNEKIIHEQAEITFERGNIPITAEGIIQDITDRQLLEEQLRQSEKMQTIGQLAGGVAHDFNNQLTAILGYGEIISMKSTDEKLKKYAQNIITASKRAADLTQQLLAYSRKSQKRSLPVDMHSLIRETISVLERSIDKKIVIKNSFEAKNPVVTGDPSLLQNAMLNLGINARDAMPDGGAITFHTENIHIDTYTQKRIIQELCPGEHIVLSVSDTGMGIPQNIQHKIFEPFFTTKSEGKGTGMGLAAVFGTIKQHGGTIRLYSEEGRGAKFNIYLPLATSQKRAATDETELENMHGTGTILVVDDEIMVREIACDILMEIGYTVLAAESPEKAITIFEKEHEKIDMVIMDIIMPGMNGKEVFNVMKKIDPQVKVLVASGYSINDDAQLMIDTGAKDFINKPFIPMELSKTVAKVLSSK